MLKSGASFVQLLVRGMVLLAAVTSSTLQRSRLLIVNGVAAFSTANVGNNAPVAVVPSFVARASRRRFLSAPPLFLGRDGEEGENPSKRRRGHSSIGESRRFGSTKSDDILAVSSGESMGAASDDGGGVNGASGAKSPPQTSTKQEKKKKKRASQTIPAAPPDPSTFPPWSYEPRPFFRFELLHESQKSMARVGRIHTPHGIIDTPSFVAVATNGALKGLDMRDADEAGQQLVFCNSYHLLLHPGPEVIEEAGGLHRFMNRRDRPLITDSGGFQVFSLAYGSVYDERSSGGDNRVSGDELKRSNRRRMDDESKGGRNNMQNSDGGPPLKVTEEGVHFKSYRDGRKIFLTPESTVRAQKSFGADIIIPLDELPPHHTDRDRLARSVELTHRWEARSLQEHLKDVREQAIYCVVHGGTDVELRTRSVEYLTSLPFDGYSIGGSLGRDADDLKELLRWMMPMFNEGHRRSKPRHLLGIADEVSVLNSVTRGIDTFDSCYPTRISRHGTLLTREGKLNINSGKHARSYGVPIDPACACSTCRHYDRPYLWHLFKAKEPLFVQLAAVHNVHYMNDLMARQRQDILDGKI